MTRARKKMTEWERDDIYRRCSFPFSTDADTTWCLALLQDGHITLSKAREWLGEYLREGKVGPLPTTQEVGESIWHERDALRAQLAAAEQDARRYRWLTDDLIGAARHLRNGLLERLPVMSYSAASDAIDAAIAASPGEAEGGAT